MDIDEGIMAASDLLQITLTIFAHFHSRLPALVIIYYVFTAEGITGTSEVW